MSFQNTKHFTQKSITSEHIMGAFYRFHRIQQNISLSDFAKQLRMNKGFLSELENGKRHFPDAHNTYIKPVPIIRRPIYEF